MLKNCTWCGRVHSNTVRDLCLTCYEKEEEEFLSVYDCVRECPGLGLSEISEKTGVKVSHILKFVRQGRLNSHNLNMALTCEICKVITKMGRICEECRKRLERKMDETPKRQLHIAETERFQNRRNE